MNILELTNEQLNIVQNALDLYSRIGIGQFQIIKEHPTFKNYLEDTFRPQKQLEVGDNTNRGEIIKITKKYIKTKGSWGNGVEIKTWEDISNIKHSIDYSEYRKYLDKIDESLIVPRNLLYKENTHTLNYSWGIYNPNVDKTCRQAFDIIQVIRHEKWKNDPNRSNVTVDSSICFSHRDDNDSSKIKCKLNIE
jgi:hypothetical protein